MIYCPSCGHVAHTRRAHFMDDGTKIMIAQCRNIYCSATFEASESFFSDCKDSGMEYISGKQRYRDSLTSASGSMKRQKRMLVTGYCCRRCKGLALAYFHERRSLNNFHRDRVITFEQIAE
ncbi:ogr/Delta-like zinc finger family protein, partial [Escherichia coli]|uniref:ogr/Delta-like zinc finger family protein n=1 Tax=Escherichia coli TaxID=562 RepID=UPI002ACD116E|nr:ogr/Delta-like zinc finger family protein [Escherichia coli]MDZ6739680.1 ogr/Delta-like zinc finger family protein [Escherichia coli]